MKVLFSLAMLVMVAPLFSHADYGDFNDRLEDLRVARGHYKGKPVARPPRSGEEITRARWCADHPEWCAEEYGFSNVPRVVVTLVPDASFCSNAGDQTARPVYRTIKGRAVFAGYECVQDNRGGN